MSRVANGMDDRQITGGKTAAPFGEWSVVSQLAISVGAVLLLAGIFLLPSRTGALQPATFWRLPLEVPALVVVMALTGVRWRGVAAWVFSGLIVAVTLLKVADMATRSALSRPFNPVFDIHLLVSGGNLLTGSVGLPLAIAVVALGVMVLFGAVWLVRYLVLAAAGLPKAARMASVSGLATVVLVTAGLLAGPLLLGNNRLPVTWASTKLVAQRVQDIPEAMRDMAAFRQEAALDDFSETPGAHLFGALEGKDVLLVFVESYGRSTHDKPEFSETIRATLKTAQEDLSADGFHMRSGWLTSPIKGGQSWLAHGSVLSGLWIDNQRRYHSLVTSERQSLLHLFRRAGWRTVGVMPAITLAWPEGLYFGYDATYAAADLGYRGEPFNWVTMPDQYTLSAFQRLELATPSRAPVMAEIALISSHAPWTPIPPLLDWDDIGDGRIFTPHARAGDPPAVVWRDRDRVRQQFMKSVDYALQNLASFATRYATDETVIVILGDHQPAPMVSGEDAGYDVPVHVIARDRAIVEAIDDWHWTPGLLPDADLEPWRMDAFRDRFTTAFSPDLRQDPSAVSQRSAESATR